MRVSIGVAGVLAGIVAGTAWAAGPTGTWSGRIFDHEEVANGWPVSYWSPTTLVVTGATVVATSEGKTMAAHDAPTARSSCSMRFRFAGARDGWRVYVQTGGRPRLTGGSTAGGYPEGSLCAASGPSGSALRIRPAGSKLKAEFTGFYGGEDSSFSSKVSGFLKRS